MSCLFPKPARHSDNRTPAPDQVRGKLINFDHQKGQLTKVSINFLKDTVALATFRELGFDGMDRKVFQHDVAAFLSKEGREWRIYAMAGGDVAFDRQGLDRYWEPQPRYDDRQTISP